MQVFHAFQNKGNWNLIRKCELYFLVFTDNLLNGFNICKHLNEFKLPNKNSKHCSDALNFERTKKKGTNHTSILR